MSEDVKIPTKEELLGEIEPQNEVEVEVQLDPIEEDAAAQGWTPKDQWKGDPKEWRPADQWLDRGRFFRTIDAQKQTIAGLEKQVAQSYEMGRKLAEADFKEKINDLKEIRRQALTEQDFVTADKVEEQIDTLKENAQRTIPKPAANLPVPPEFHVFQDRNPWYGQHRPVLYHTANAIGIEFLKQNPTSSPADLYWHVEKSMKEEFPNLEGKTTETKERKLPANDGGGSQSGGSKGDSSSYAGVERNMTELDRSIMNTLVKQKTFGSKEEYLKQYVKLNGKG
jgi:hypothetical protein